jgi:hypothetical protein
VSANVTLVPPPKGMITTLCSLAKFTSLTTSSWQPRKKYKKALNVRHTLDASCDVVYLLASLMIDTLFSFFTLAYMFCVLSPGQTTMSGSRAIVPQRRSTRSSRVCPWLRKSRSSVSIEYETPLYISSFIKSLSSKMNERIIIFYFYSTTKQSVIYNNNNLCFFFIVKLNRSYRHLQQVYCNPIYTLASYLSM